MFPQKFILIKFTAKMRGKKFGSFYFKIAKNIAIRGKKWQKMWRKIAKKRQKMTENRLGPLKKSLSRAGGGGRKNQWDDDIGITSNIYISCINCL